MKIGCLWGLLIALPLAHAEERCRAKLIDENKRLSTIDILLDLEGDRDHLIASFYNYRDIKSTERPFAIREELRYALRKQDGADWLDKGKNLLGELAQQIRFKKDLSEGDLKLANGTLLFLKMEWVFENADIRDEQNRMERITIEHDLAIAESTIDEMRAEIGQEPLPDRIYSDDHPAKMNREMTDSKNLIEQSRANMTKIYELLTALRDAGVYEQLNIDLDKPLDVEAYWRSLGYPGTPY